jgi:hypothetical protein
MIHFSGDRPFPGPASPAPRRTRPLPHPLTPYVELIVNFCPPG